MRVGDQPVNMAYSIVVSASRKEYAVFHNLWIDSVTNQEAEKGESLIVIDCG